MKKTTTSSSVTTYFSLFIVFTALSLATQIETSFAQTDGVEMGCQSSQRGTRCGKIQTNENVSFTASSFEEVLVMDEDFCSTTSRGSRCIRKMDDFAMAIGNEDPAPLSSRNVSARGTRT